MTFPLWLPGAQRLATSHAGEQMLGGPARAVWHRTVGQDFAGNANYLRQEGYEPHLLWDPTTGQIGQFLPANVSGYALEHPSGTTQTNREGSVCIQIEVADHGQTWDITSTPMKGWNSIRAWLALLGVPEVWPVGPPPPLNSRQECPLDVWLNRAGHYSHSQVPNNHHTDPGRMDLAVMFTGPHPLAPGEDTVTDAQIEAVAQRVYALLHPDHAVMQHGDANHPNSLDAIAQGVVAIRTKIGA